MVKKLIPSSRRPVIDRHKTAFVLQPDKSRLFNSYFTNRSTYRFTVNVFDYFVASLINIFKQFLLFFFSVNINASKYVLYTSKTSLTFEKRLPTRLISPWPHSPRTAFGPDRVFH